jgi:hypothetical protein
MTLDFFFILTPVAFIGIAVLHVWQAVRHHRQEQDRRDLRGGVKPWWGGE